MVFLIDIPSDYTKNRASKSDLVYFLVKAHEIYNFLFELGCIENETERSRFRNLRKLIIINADKSLNLKEFTRVMADYSPDPRVYGEILEENDINRFPTANKLIDKFVKSRIKDILQNAEIINLKGSSIDKVTGQLCENRTEFSFYLPLCNEPSKELIKSLYAKKQEIYLYSESESMKLKSFTGLKEIKAARYMAIESKLTEAKEMFSKIEPDLFEVRNQTPQNLFEALGESFAATIKRIKEKEIKHIVIQGQDRFLIYQIAKDIILSETPLFFDLSKGLPYFDKDISSSVVLLNLHKLQESLGKKKLFDLIKAVDKAGDIVIVQCNDSSWERDFYGYERILLPSESELQVNATSLFNSLLMYNNLYDGLLYKLFLFGRTSCLNQLIPGVKSITTLNTIIKSLALVSETDLLNNIAFWCGIEMEAEALLLEEGSIDGVDEEEIIPETITFDLIGDNWVINMPGCTPTIIPYKSYVGLKYLIVILQNHKYGHEKRIHVKQLREIVLKYAGEFNFFRNKETTDDLESLRKNISEAIDTAVKKENHTHSHLKKFYDDHIDKSNYYFSFMPKGKNSGRVFKCEVNDPYWKNSLLTDH